MLWFNGKFIFLFAIQTTITESHVMNMPSTESNHYTVIVLYKWFGKRKLWNWVSNSLPKIKKKFCLFTLKFGRVFMVLYIWIAVENINIAVENFVVFALHTHSQLYYGFIIIRSFIIFMFCF